MRYRKWRAVRKRGRKEILMRRGKRNIPDISLTQPAPGGEAWNEARADSWFVKHRCIIQADIKGLLQPSAMMGGDGKRE